MKEYYNAKDVSLHVRCSNEAAIGLYTGRLGFARERVESKYYADGEDAWCMRLVIPEVGEEGEDKTVGKDEGEAVGNAGAGDTSQDNGNMRKVKVGRQLGVGDLVEVNENKEAGTVVS